MLSYCVRVEKKNKSESKNQRVAKKKKKKTNAFIKMCSV